MLAQDDRGVSRRPIRGADRRQQARHRRQIDGGRIASQVAAAPAKTDAVAGLVLLGYPLHPPGQPDKLRTAHLPAIRAPVLIVQGSRDSFGTPDELRPVLARLTAPVDLFVVEGGDHSFKVPKKAVPSQDAVYERVLDEINQWLRGRLSRAVS